MSSRPTKDPYSTSLHELDSMVSATFKAENDLKKKTDKLQKELQNSLLLYHREKVELNDFLADLRAPLGPRVVRTRKHSLGRGGSVVNSRGSHKPRSLPERRLSEPPQPVDHFPTSVIYDPFAWVDDGNESDESHETVENKAVDIIPTVTLPESLPERKTRRHSVPKKASALHSTSSRLPSIHLTRNANPGPISLNPVALNFDHCPHIAPETVGQPPSNNDNPADAEHHGPPMLTLSTVANLKMGSSDLRRRIQKWCDNINEELFPFTEHESLKKVDDSIESKNGQGDGKQHNEGPIPPKITITSVINSVMGKGPTHKAHITETPQDCGHQFQNKYSSQVATSHGKSSVFQPNIPEKGLPSPLSLETIRTGKSASTTTEPTTPVSLQRSSKALSLYRELDKLTKSPRKLSQVNATDLRVVSKSMQSFHDCKVYRGRNSIPSKSTDSKAFDELARAQYRLVQRQRIRAKQHGTSYDFGERVDAQIKKRNSVRWSM